MKKIIILLITISSSLFADYNRFASKEYDYPTQEDDSSRSMTGNNNGIQEEDIAINTNTTYASSEVVDEVSGMLSIRSTDLAFPGIGKLNLKLDRVFTLSTGNIPDAYKISKNWAFDLPSIIKRTNEKNIFFSPNAGVSYNIKDAIQAPFEGALKQSILVKNAVIVENNIIRNVEGSFFEGSRTIYIPRCKSLIKIGSLKLSGGWNFLEMDNIEYITPNGVVYKLSKYDDAYIVQSITDLNNSNNILFEYTPFTRELLIEEVRHDIIKNEIDPQVLEHTISKPFKLTKIIDTFERTFTFNYKRYLFKSIGGGPREASLIEPILIDITLNNVSYIKYHIDQLRSIYYFPRLLSVTRNNNIDKNDTNYKELKVKYDYNLHYYNGVLSELKITNQYGGLSKYLMNDKGKVTQLTQISDSSKNEIDESKITLYSYSTEKNITNSYLDTTKKYGKTVIKSNYIKDSFGGIVNSKTIYYEYDGSDDNKKYEGTVLTQFDIYNNTHNRYDPVSIIHSSYEKICDEYFVPISIANYTGKNKKKSNKTISYDKMGNPIATLDTYYNVHDDKVADSQIETNLSYIHSGYSNEWENIKEYIKPPSDNKTDFEKFKEFIEDTSNKIYEVVTGSVDTVVDFFDEIIQQNEIERFATDVIEWGGKYIPVIFNIDGTISGIQNINGVSNLIQLGSINDIVKVDMVNINGEAIKIFKNTSNDVIHKTNEAGEAIHDGIVEVTQGATDLVDSIVENGEQISDGVVSTIDTSINTVEGLIKSIPTPSIPSLPKFSVVGTPGTPNYSKISYYSNTINTYQPETTNEFIGNYELSTYTDSKVIALNSITLKPGYTTNGKELHAKVLLRTLPEKHVVKEVTVTKSKTTEQKITRTRIEDEYTYLTKIEITTNVTNSDGKESSNTVTTYTSEPENPTPLSFCMVKESKITDLINPSSYKKNLLSYDNRLNKTSEKVVRLNIHGNEEHLSTLYEYDTNNRITKITNPDNNITTIGYDQYNIYITQNYNGSIIKSTKEYNIRGLLVNEYINNNSLASNEQLYSKSYEYDELDRLTKVKTNNKVLKTISYTNAISNNTTEITDIKGNKLYINKDGLNRTVERKSFVKDTLTSYETMEYHPLFLDKVTTWTQNDNSPQITVITEYDNLGRAISSKKNNIITSQLHYYDEENYIITTNYLTDSNNTPGNLKLNYLKVCSDWQGNVTDTYQSTFTDELQIESDTNKTHTKNKYNSFGDKISVSLAFGTPEQLEFNYVYNNLGQLIETIYPNNGGSEKTTYNSIGKPYKFTDRKNITTTTIYNSLGLPASITSPDTKIEYTYSAEGKPATIITTDNSGNLISSYLYIYDRYGNLTKENIKLKDNIGTRDYSLSRDYDEIGSVTTTGISTNTYSKEVQYSYPYNSLNSSPENKISVLNNNQSNIATFNYNKLGNIDSILFGNGVTSIYSDLDIFLRPQSVSTNKRDGSSLLSLKYKYDHSGNITWYNDGVNINNYSYDGLSQLKTENDITYTYDLLNNKSKTEDGTKSKNYFYNTTTSNKMMLDSITDSSDSSKNVAYTYDKNGNTISKQVGLNVWTYEYNSYNKLIRALNGTLVVGIYRYDNYGHRVYKLEGDKETFYIYEGNNIIFEESNQVSENTSITRIFNVLLQGNNIAKYVDNTIQYHVLDHLSSRKLTLDDQENIIDNSSVTYSAFGLSLNSSSNYNFTGKQVDNGTGLVYFNARFYDPETGRFITQDPIKDGNNWYIYCYNNPMNFIDPTGLAVVDGEYIPDGLIDSGDWDDELLDAGSITENDGGSYDWSNWTPNESNTDLSIEIAKISSNASIFVDLLSKTGKAGSFIPYLGPVFSGISVLADTSSVSDGAITPTRYVVNTAITGLALFPPTAWIGSTLSIANAAVGDNIAQIPDNITEFNNIMISFDDHLYSNFENNQGNLMEHFNTYYESMNQ